LVRLNEPTEAAKTAAELPPLFPNDPTGYLDAGRFFASRAVLAEKAPKLPEAERRQLARAWADWVMPLPHKAIRKGHKDIDRLKDSSQLDEDAKHLLADWVEKAKQINENWCPA